MSVYRVNFPDQAANSAGRIAGWARNALDSVANVTDILTVTGGELFANLEAEDGATYGVGLSVTSVFSNLTGSTAFEPVSGVGVFPEGVFRGSAITSNGGTGAIKFTGLTPGASYTLIAQCHQGNASRATDMTVDGVTQTYDSVASDEPQTTNLTFTGIIGVSGELPISVVKAATGGQYYGAIGAIELTVQGPTVSLTGSLEPGASFSLSYTNYDAAPVSPVTMTDSAGNSITVPVTISDSVNGTTGKHEGTAAGTMPALPSSGSIAGLKFGTINVNLSS